MSLTKLYSPEKFNWHSPLPIRISIRDVYEPASSTVQKALARLNSEVGYEFSLVVPWADIHRDLSSSFPDASVLVPSVSSALTAYLNRIVDLIDNQEFQDAFLEKTSSVVTRDINIRIGEDRNQASSEIDRNGKWILSLPQNGPQWYRTMTSRIGHDLEDVFLDRKKDKPAAAPIAAPSTAATGDWVDVVDPVTQITNKIKSLPSLSTLSKPESLFASVLPYYVIVTNSGASIHIESSHQRTIDLVHQYLQMHTRKNMNLTTQVLAALSISTNS